MTLPINCHIKTIAFDENYQPAKDTRLTTNFPILPVGNTASKTYAIPCK